MEKAKLIRAKPKEELQQMSAHLEGRAHTHTHVLTTGPHGQQTHMVHTPKLESTYAHTCTHTCIHIRPWDVLTLT